MTIDAEDLFLRRYLGLDDDAVTAATAQWIRGKQRSDGTWATYYGGPGDLSTTVEAYVALRLAGDPADAAHMRRAAEFVRDGGGIECSRVFTRMWLSLLSLWRWEQVPAIPPELMFLPPGAPLSIYSFGCWARQTIVALAIVSALRPTTTVPFGVDELLTRRRAVARRATRGAARSSCSTAGCTATSGGRSARCGAGRCTRPSATSSTARSATARGAASSRRGSGR